MLLILGRLLISEHGLCYLCPQLCCFTLCLSVLTVKENFPDSFYSPFYPLSECDFSSASLNYAVLDNVGLNCTGPRILGFFSWLVCVARYICDWIFLAVLYPALHRTWNVKHFHWSQLTDFPWSVGSGASWGFSVLNGWGTGSLSDTTQSTWGACSIFLPLAWL